MREHQYYVYILTRTGEAPSIPVSRTTWSGAWPNTAPGKCGFTARYGIGKLIYFETTDDVWAAIAREKQIKGWLREKKFELIRTLNPRVRDLSWDFAPPSRRAKCRVLGESRAVDDA
jgi:putative endonuclease